MQLLYCLNTSPASLRCTIETATVHRGSYEDHASHEVSGAKPDEPVTQPPVSKTKEEVFQLWERRSHRPVLSLKTTRKGSQRRIGQYQTVRSLSSQTNSPCNYEPGDRRANTGLPEEVPSRDDVFSRAVGKCPIANVKLGGVLVPCLLDSGSEVSTITESFFHENFRSKGFFNENFCSKGKKMDG